MPLGDGLRGEEVLALFELVYLGHSGGDASRARSALDGQAQAGGQRVVLRLDLDAERLELANLLGKEGVGGVLGEALALRQRDQVAEVEIDQRRKLISEVLGGPLVEVRLREARLALLDLFDSGRVGGHDELLVEERVGE